MVTDGYRCWDSWKLTRAQRGSVALFRQRRLNVISSDNGTEKNVVCLASSSDYLACQLARHQASDNVRTGSKALILDMIHETGLTGQAQAVGRCR